ncbi:hypothetical protein SBOR_6850 [Sclerotinia borealis F-4128]|uniref:Uncharacterized protein n=1 Tax=Sclerotinia borealis (strain F-4128) TaxID=1432307 RepID=W9CAJ1_SCLBF|nr:hypothetical protein SBOR_6850 [Sclerotinia borealis F-4128]
MSTPHICRLSRSKFKSQPTNFFTSIPAPQSSRSRTLKPLIPQRFFSSSCPLTSHPPKPSHTPISATSFSSSRSRLQARLLTLQSRIPKFLHPYTAPLLTAPKTYIISFLVLHEITALVPLILLAGGFHYTGCLPSDLIPEGKLEATRERFERWFGKKGWFGYEGATGSADALGNDGQTIMKAGENNTSGKRIVLEVATAYVVTKILLPIRILVCVWGTPWFAGIMGRIGRLGRGGGVK